MEYHWNIDFVEQFIFAQFDFWGGFSVSRWSRGAAVELGTAWGWEMNELQWRLGFGVPTGALQDGNRSLFSVRGGIYHSLDWNTLSPWFGLAWSQEWKGFNFLRFEGGIEGGVRLGEEFQHEEEKMGVTVTHLARVWVALFLRVGK